MISPTLAAVLLNKVTSCWNTKVTTASRARRVCCRLGCCHGVIVDSSFVDLGSNPFVSTPGNAWSHPSCLTFLSLAVIPVTYHTLASSSLYYIWCECAAFWDVLKDHWIFTEHFFSVFYSIKFTFCVKSLLLHSNDVVYTLVLSFSNDKDCDSATGFETLCISMLLCCLNVAQCWSYPTHALFDITCFRGRIKLIIHFFLLVLLTVQ